MESQNCPNSSNKSNCVEELNNVECITTASKREGDETFTVVDVYNKFLGSLQSCMPEKFCQDSGEEQEYERSAEIAKLYEGTVLCDIIF
jgi:hypothetical protein